MVGPKCCPETSVRNYHSSLPTKPGERSSQWFESQFELKKN